MTVAIVNFRTIPNGTFSYLRNGQRRGFWRVLVVKDVNGPLIKTSRNVVAVPFESHAGIDGVTARSAYCLDGAYLRALEVAEAINRESLVKVAGALMRHHMPEGLPL